MKWLCRSFALAAAFLLGVGIVSLLPTIDSDASYPELHVSDPPVLHTTRAIAPTGISVMYAGWDRGDAGPYLKFIIHNGLDRHASYTSHNPMNPFATLTANGRKLHQLLSCGTGMKSFSIAPGMAAEVHIPWHAFLERPGKGEFLTAGFYLFAEEAGASRLYTSERFFLPDEFRKSIETLRY